MIVAADEFLDPRADLFAPATAVKHAVMANTLLHVMHAHIIGQIGTQFMRGPGLPHTGNVIAFAFDRQKGGLGDCRWINRNTLPTHGAIGQVVIVEHDLDGLQIELGSHVHHGKIFVIEVPLGIGTFAVTFDQMHEHVMVGRNVAIPVHGHKARQLHKARINPAHDPGIG